MQNGTSKRDITTATAMAEDESVTVAGHYREAGGFKAAKLDADGTLLWQWEDGTAEEDIVKGLAMAEDGSTIIAGSTKGDWNMTNMGEHDLAVLKLDADGTLLWKWQV
ncbi:unnamed protein product, partial [Laminaria digitata]